MHRKCGIHGKLEMLVYLKSVGCPWSERRRPRFGRRIKDIGRFGGCGGGCPIDYVGGGGGLRSSLGIWISWKGWIITPQEFMEKYLAIGTATERE